MFSILFSSFAISEVEAPDLLMQIWNEQLHLAPLGAEQHHGKMVLASRATVGLAIASPFSLAVVGASQHPAGRGFFPRSLAGRPLTVSPNGAVTSWASGAAGLMLAVCSANTINDQHREDNVVSDKKKAIEGFKKSDVWPSLVEELGSEPRVENFLTDVMSGWDPKTIITKYVSDADEREKILTSFGEERKELEALFATELNRERERVRMNKLLDRISMERAFFKLVTKDRSAAYQGKVAQALKERSIQLREALAAEKAARDRFIRHVPPAENSHGKGNSH